NNLTAVFDGPPAECTPRATAGVWYSWQADFTGKAKFNSGADFNDVANVYTGGCASPQSMTCNNRDEHGFTGESTYFDAVAGNTYLIRVSGTEEPYGVARGNLCARVEAVANAPAQPVNDACDHALDLTVNGPCIAGNNRNGTMSTQLPSLNELARSDVWYRFTAPPALTANQILQVQSNASFSDIITLYAGGCNNLTEIAGNHHGRSLDLPALTEGQTYYVQIAGNFASIEGDLCPQILKKQENAPANDNCIAAETIALNGQCTPGTNAFAGFSGNIPPCVSNVTSDVWYKFTATASGAVRINTGAQFEHVMAVWSGDCNGLTPIFCADNPKRCDGFVLVGNLTAGQTYYIQIASKEGPAGIETGDFCLKVLDAALQPEFSAMELQVEENCNSLSTAAIKIKVNGGMQPYTFEGTPNNAVLNSGDAYLVVVTDAIGCQKSWVGVVDNCAQSGCTLAASVTQQYPLCHNSADGSLMANIAGGTPPYTYNWSNGVQGQSITGLTSGTYGLTIQDALGCDINLGYVLNSPDPILVAPSDVTQPTTGLNNGAIYVDVIGGAGMYNYAWSRNGVPFVNAEDLTGAPGGDYTLFVTDANGCTATLQYTLTEIVGSQNPTQTVFAEIFPNPAKDKATLTLALPKASNVQWSIIDGSGKIMRQANLENVLDQDIALDMKDLSAGAYLVKIVVGEAVYYRKLVIGK
ncbi:MAG: T9SS type A sorting domain-containing protein, partial [Bacteroidota bacterium]